MSKCGAETEVYSRVVGYFRPVKSWNKGKKEEFRERKTFKVPAAVPLLALAALLFLLSGCSHNTGAFTIGTRVNAGLDPQNATANLSYTDGLNIVDVSRENSFFDLEIDSVNGVSVDESSGNIRGIKRIRREVGPQITGYLVDLSKTDPALAGEYLTSMKYYWQYRAAAAGADVSAGAEKTTTDDSADTPK